MAFSKGGTLKPSHLYCVLVKKVAVIGSGACGISCRCTIEQGGAHEVVVYERDDTPGGLPNYGIPDFKILEKMW